MLFNSFVYIALFLPLSIVVYFALNHRQHMQAGKLWLFAASLFFYGYWNPQYIALIIISILVNFFVGKSLQATPDRRVLTAGIGFNLALLAYYKYTDFLIENINHLSQQNIQTLQIILPLGISFFTFQKIAYLVDSHQNKCREKNFIDFCLFVTFFPQLISGPIVHHREMMSQFANTSNKLINWHNMNTGLLIFGIGLFKKVFFADTFAIWVEHGFNQTDGLTFFEAWTTSLGYTMQIYFDFSGYTDMAIGSAIMMNIHLPQNFNSPYRATNIREFWLRWHMTLSRWLRDYLYIPLGGSHHGSLQTFSNLLITFLLGGLWHGASWTFVIWGGLHGIAAITHRLWSRHGFRLHRAPAALITFIFVNIAWVFFRAEDTEQALRILNGMADFSSIPEINAMIPQLREAVGLLSPVDVFAPGTATPSMILTALYLAVAMAVCLFPVNSHAAMQHMISSTSTPRQRTLQTASILIFSYALFLMAYCKFRTSPFIYFNF